MKKAAIILFLLFLPSFWARAETALIISAETAEGKRETPGLRQFLAVLSGQLPTYKFVIFKTEELPEEDAQKRNLAYKKAEEYMVKRVVMLLFEREALSALIFFVDTKITLPVSVVSAPEDPSPSLYSLAIKIKSAFMERTTEAVFEKDPPPLQAQPFLEPPLMPARQPLSPEGSPILSPETGGESDIFPEYLPPVYPLLPAHEEKGGYRKLELFASAGIGRLFGMGIFQASFVGGLSFFPISPFGFSIAGGGTLKNEIAAFEKSIFFNRYIFEGGFSGRYDLGDFSLKGDILIGVDYFIYDLTALKIEFQRKANPNIVIAVSARYHPVSWLFVEIKPHLVTYFRTQRLYDGKGDEILGAPIIAFTLFTGIGAQFF